MHLYIVYTYISICLFYTHTHTQSLITIVSIQEVKIITDSIVKKMSIHTTKLCRALLN